MQPCTRCGDTKTEATAKLPHTPGAGVRENEKPATCEDAGSYELVIYCTVCKAEISRETEAISPFGHKVSTSWSWDEEVHYKTCANNPSERLEVAEHNFVNNTCTVCGFVETLEPTEGLVYKLSSDRTYFIVSNIGTASTSDIVIPADLADGTYTLYMAAKDTRESTWERIRTMYGGVDQYTVTVSGNQCVFTPHALSKAIDNVVMSLSPTHTFYEGSLMDFVVTIQNNDPVYEYYGEISVSLYESDGSVQYTPFGGLPVIVKPGEIVEVPISGSLSLQSGSSIVPLPAGTYLAAVIYGWGPYSYPNNNGLIQVDVLVSTGQLTLGAQNARLAKTRIGLNAPLNYMATLEGFGRGSYYSSTVGVALDADKGDGRIPYMQNVFFESGETYEFTAEFVPELGAGDHSVTLCAYSETAGGYQVVDGTQVNFTIDPTVGIEDAVGGATNLTVLDQPVEDVLTMTAPAGLQTLNIYNQAGQLVSTVDLSATSGERYSVEVSNLVSGFYIVNATAADGKTFRSKFVKK